MRIGNRARKQLGNVSGVANDLLLPPGVDCGILQKNTGSTPMNHSDDPPLGMSAESWRVLSGELDRVLELPESEQQSWLAALHTRDPVSAAWMKRLLAARGSERFADFLQESPGVPVRDLERASLAGTRVGAYQVDAEVGHGGMGSVWRAHRADGSFEGTVALKFLHAYFLGSDGERRFRAEGRLLARLDHPHIARLIDAGVLNGREPYLVLEYVEGEPIDAYCERQALGLEARIRLFLDVLAAVVHAHGHLIVHRDIKPSNILVTAAGTVKLLDFGIAKLLDEGEGVGALSQTRWAALTPLYAAPEQILAQPITTATDVYSLGLVLFRLLTGKHAVMPEDHAGGQALHAILTGNPQRASAVASVAGIPARSLAGDIDNILGKALKRDPAERYSTAQTFADDLRRYLADEPVTARADTWSYRARKLRRRRRGAVLSAAAVAIALVAISGIALWQAHRAGRERDSAVQEARRADSVGDFTIMLLDDFSRDATPRAVRANLDRARQLLEQQHYRDPEVRGTLLVYLAGRYEEFGYARSASELFRQAAVDAKLSGDRVAVVQVGCDLANVLDDLGEDADAERAVDAAMQTMDRLSGIRPEVRSECHMVQSYIATALGRNKAAVAAAQKSLDEVEAAGVHSELEHLTELNAVARARAYAGDNAIAVTLLRQIRASASETGPPQTMSAWIHLFHEATALFAGGRVREAAQLTGVLLATAHGSESISQEATVLRAQTLIALNQPAVAADSLKGLPEGTGTPEEQLDRGLLEIEARMLAGDGDAAYLLWGRWHSIATRVIARGGAQAVPVLRTEALLELDANPTGADQLLARAAGLAVDADGVPTPARRDVNVLRAELALRRSEPQAACRLADAIVTQAQREAVDRSSSAWIGEGLLLRARCAKALGDGATMRSSAQVALRQLQDNLGEDHPSTLLARSLAGS